MRLLEHTVKAEEGLHARPAGQLVKLAQRHACIIEVQKGCETVNAKRLMAVMGLGVQTGDTVTFRLDGEDEEAALQELEALCRDTL